MFGDAALGATNLQMIELARSVGGECQSFCRHASAAQIVWTVTCNRFDVSVTVQACQGHLQAIHCCCTSVTIRIVCLLSESSYVCLRYARVCTSD